MSTPVIELDGVGRTYPGPGSTIGPALVFGWRAGTHMAKVAAAV